MSAVTDGQAAGTTNGIADAKNVGAGGNTSVPIQPASDITTEVFVSGTAQQLHASRDKVLYINVTTAAALAVSMGPTSAGTGVPVSISQSSALGVISVRVPKGWYVKITGTIADIATTSVIGG